jgi:hypothetical protein
MSHYNKVFNYPINKSGGESNEYEETSDQFNKIKQKEEVNKEGISIKGKRNMSNNEIDNDIKQRIYYKKIT